MAVLSLNGIVDVSVQLTPTTALRRGFNTALIIGQYTSAENVDVAYYQTLNDVLEEFGSTSDIYKAASVYFAQEYVPGGVYCAQLNQTTSGGTTVNETLADGIARCRLASPEWYVCIPTVAVLTSLSSSDYTTISTYIESAEPVSMIGYTLTDSSTYADILAVLKAGGYTKTFSMYDDVSVNTSDAGKAVVAAPIAYALGRNNTRSMAYTLAYKKLKGVTVDTNMQATELNTLLGLNGNIYINQGYYYDILRQGHMASGDSFDEIMYIDMMVADIKGSVMDALTSNAKIPQTEQGISLLEAGIMNVLEQYRDIEFIAPGVWNGSTVLALNNGDVLPAGYLIQFESIASQTLAQRTSRIAPPCYICVKLAGAIEHVTISLIVDK